MTVRSSHGSRRAAPESDEYVTVCEKVYRCIGRAENSGGNGWGKRKKKPQNSTNQNDRSAPPPSSEESWGSCPCGLLCLRKQICPVEIAERVKRIRVHARGSVGRRFG
ncbi:hypothetical protein EVAR_30536_1 [Eumeta japonica]|uniref:Uncharacterized protein n=1 Tax=Eumeta variegata TaxID=151549 RepID=A0A4C1VMZ4_EUMVA|nr:hypothetical protein EVAR_30536_1 [Eumeta japonica]